MLRAVLCVSIVAAFPLSAGAAASEDIPIPGGRAALVDVAGIRAAPERARFVAEVTRLIFETSSRERRRPESPAGRASAHLLMAARVQRALGPAQTNGSVSLVGTRDGARRQFAELLNAVGLRLRERRGAYTVDAKEFDEDPVYYVRLLAGLGIDVNALASALGRGDTLSITLPVETVPLPLSAAVWSDVIFERDVPPAEIFAAILADERATLLCHGLAALDDPTLDYLSAHPAALRAMYVNAGVFAAFGSQLKIRDGRLVTPGETQDEAARAIWEDLTEARVGDPARFIASLLERRAGRLAYLYDMVGELDPPHAAFALNLWMKDPVVRTARARALLEAATAAYPEWPAPQRPFVRPMHDLASLLNSVAVNADGSPAGPSGLGLWQEAFAAQELPDDAETRMRDADRKGAIDASWLAETVILTDVRLRGERLMQVAFGFRVFDAASPAHEVLVALRAFGRYRTVMLGLEQMGLRRSAIYVAAARRAAALARLEGDRAFVAISQFQGALALLVRLAWTGAVDANRIEALVESLSAVPLNSDGRLVGGIAEWLRSELLAEQGDADAEHNLIAALAGPPLSAPRVVEWEGAPYHFDLAAAEAERLRRVRRRQDGYTLDAALQLYSTARSLSAASIDVEGIARGAAAVERLQKLLPRKPPAMPSDLVPGGTENLPDPADVLERAHRELTRLARLREVERAGAVAAELAQAVDVVLAEVLSSIAYALTLGDPEGPTLLGGDVARRHDFGIGSRVPGIRAGRPWSLPEQHYDPGVPWHVTGSLVGLDIAMAPLALKRLIGDGLPGPPVLGSNDRETFARSVALMNPYVLKDVERDRIGTTLARGRERAAEARTDAEIDGIADAVRMDGWRRRALRWTTAHEPELKISFLSLVELFVLGGGDVAELHAWGSAMTPVWGCLCTRMPAPNAWRFVTGRPQQGVLATALPDLMLHVAATLHELDLPAGLARSVLGTAVQQFVDTVQPNDGNDWLALVRGAQEISRERFEDFVAAAAAVGGPLVPVASAATRDR
jgi:hypothetical protein